MTAPRTIQRFRIDAVLGRGGMGEVYRAYDPQLDRAVAIKVLATSQPVAELAAEPATLDLRRPAGPGSDELLAEARVMAQVSDPHVLPIYEVGLDARGVFLVMELVEGDHLGSWLAATPRTTAEIVAMFVQAARGLAAAHARGVVHRDFKPENVLVGNDGRARVADFGISALVGRPASEALVRVGDALAGTPHYMAPELWRGEPASARSDVYAFAVALVEALGGDPESLAPPARRAITAALAEASADRPRDASVLVAALTARRSRAAHVAVAAGVATVVAAGGLVFALRGSDAAPPDCDPDPSRFAGSWDPAYKAKLAAALDPAAPDLRAELDRAYAVGDAIVVDDTAMRVASCRAHAAGTLTAPQLAMRMACLDRRIYELGARVEFVAAKPKRAASLASAALTNLPGLDRCAVVEGSPLATAEARADAKALYRRFFIGGDMVAPDAAAALAPVIVDAAKTGDLELASRAATRRAEKLSATSGPDVDPVLVEAHRYAVLAKSDAAAAQALVERSKHALGRFDFGGARALAEQALELVDRAYVPAITRAAIFHAVGRAAARRGDPITGLTFLRRGLAAIDPRTERAHSTRIDLQLDQLRALEAIEGTAAERLRIAVDTIELARIRYRGTGADYRSALELAGSAAKALGDHAKAQQYERAALEAVLAQKTYTPATEVRRRAMLAIELVRAGKFADAYAQYSEAAKQAGELPEIARDRPVYLAAAGATLAAMGRLEEANVILEETIVDFAERYGKDHDKTAQVIRLVTAFELELGRFDSAARRIDQLERALRAKSEPTDEARARLTGELAARLVLLRGNATAADELARRTLSSFEELGATREAKSGTQRVRLEALGELHRYGEARDLAIAELELARTKADDPAAIAMLEVELARAEYGLGNRAAALQRARNVAPVLDKWRISPIARKKLAELRARPE